LVGDRPYWSFGEKTNLRREGFEASYASRWSAIGSIRQPTRKNALTGAAFSWKP
jgi:hypothetical protein